MIFNHIILFLCEINTPHSQTDITFLMQNKLSLWVNV